MAVFWTGSKRIHDDRVERLFGENSFKGVSP